jgi:serpin B
VLVNAVYFKGTWLNTFSEALTADRPFTMANGEPKTTPTMYGKIPSRYAELPGMKILELPYRGDECVMTIVLPEKPDGLPAIEAAMNGKSFAEWNDALRSQEVMVYLPRFSLTSQFSLNKTLAELGMTDAFDEGRANFAGMDGKENNLFISAAIHKAFVDVNEKGTEAAAATAVIMQARAMPRPAPEFRADRPFLFYISDRTTKSILFIGRLSEPPDAAGD